MVALIKWSSLQKVWVNLLQKSLMRLTPWLKDGRLIPMDHTGSGVNRALAVILQDSRFISSHSLAVGVKVEK